MSFDTHCTGCSWRIISSWGGGVHVVGGQCGLISVSLYLYHWEQIWLISLSSQHLRPDSTDHNHSPFGSASCYLVFFFSSPVSQPNSCIGISVFVFLLFSVASNSSYLNNNSLSCSFPCSNGALWEYTLYAKGVSVGNDSAVISVQGCVRPCVCVRMCLFVCACG